jgi:hypothetical protein
MTHLEFLHFMTEECGVPATESEKLWAHRPANFHEMTPELLRLLLLVVDGPTDEINPVTGGRIHPTSRTPLPLLARRKGGSFDIEL